MFGILYMIHRPSNPVAIVLTIFIGLGFHYSVQVRIWSLPYDNDNRFSAFRLRSKCNLLCVSGAQVKPWPLCILARQRVVVKPVPVFGAHTKSAVSPGESLALDES